MTSIELKDVGKTFGDFEAIPGVDLRIDEGEFVALVGPSGCGKSTLLRIICGLEECTRGDVLIDGESVLGVPAGQRGVAMVFQSYALYPHMNVAQNMGFALRMMGASAQEQAERVNAAAQILRLEELMDRKPAQLSGGQRQRVAIGRAIVRKPKVFLFDEPLSNLDAALRSSMRLELAKLHRELNATMVYVTHDQVEAVTLADRIVVLNQGQVQQVGKPLELYNRPMNTFVAGFIGSPKMNFIASRAGTGDAGIIPIESADFADLAIRNADRPIRPGEELTIGVRPEGFAFDASAGPRVEGEIEFVEHLGNITYVTLNLPSSASATVAVPNDFVGAISQKAAFGMMPSQVHLFDGQGNVINAEAVERS